MYCGDIKDFVKDFLSSTADAESNATFTVEKLFYKLLVQ